MQQLSELEGNLKKIIEFGKRYTDIKELFELAVIENDTEVLNSCQIELHELVSILEDEEFKLQFNGKADDKSCYIEIHAGAGGTESQDWAQMLTRMYLRWAEKNNFKFKLIHEAIGDEAGIKSCTALIEGNYAFGYLKKESVNVWGFDLNKNPRQVRASIGIVPQEINLDAFFSPKKLLELQAGLYGIKKEDRITDLILKMVALEDKANAYSRSLSGGMKRRLLIAKAMVHQPPILILDEPTAGVDVELRNNLWKNVKQLNKEGVTIILTTHYLLDFLLLKFIKFIC